MQMSKACALEERDLFELERLQEFAWTVNFRHNCRRFFVYIFAFNHTCLEPSLYVPLTYQKHRVSPSSTPRLVFLGQGLPVKLEFFGWLDWLVTKAQGLPWAGIMGTTSVFSSASRGCKIKYVCLCNKHFAH